MTYLIIALALLFVIAPIFAILPSARQKMQMRLRKIAMSEGISVELTSIRDPVPHQDKYIGNTGKSLEPILSLVAYRKIRPRQKQSPEVSRFDWTMEKRESPSSGLPDNWHWDPAEPAGMSVELKDFLARELETLPVDLVKIDEVNYFLSAYWHESSGEAGLASIVRFLKACTEITPCEIDDDSEAS